jgi:hypothetical protein
MQAMEAETRFDYKAKQFTANDQQIHGAHRAPLQNYRPPSQQLLQMFRVTCALNRDFGRHNFQRTQFFQYNPRLLPATMPAPSARASPSSPPQAGVIVGAPPTQRGVVCTASYEARKLGVSSALPGAPGRICPKGK